jgi:hypothetical protein
MIIAYSSLYTIFIDTTVVKLMFVEDVTYFPSLHIQRFGIALQIALCSYIEPINDLCRNNLKDNCAIQTRAMIGFNLWRRLKITD